MRTGAWALAMTAAACLSAEASAQAGAKEARAPHVVFVTGDHEYRSEESMPMLGRILHRDFGLRVTVCYALGADGAIDPMNDRNIAGLEALEQADLMVMFLRWRKLPDDQLKRIVDYAESGRPMVGFRTSTHPFNYPAASPNAAAMNQAWPAKVFGQHWITHHGHFGDGKEFLTEVSLLEARQERPILRGVVPFEAYSWLYHVDGKGAKLSGDADALVSGRALKSGAKGFPLTQPVAWTKTYTGTAGKPARVFFTTLGHPYDFKLEPMRRLALNGILWALGMEAKIPPGGAKVQTVGPYEPNNSGDDYKKGVRPAPIGAK
jgi:type 1 glutamine amidotransferase